MRVQFLLRTLLASLILAVGMGVAPVASAWVAYHGGGYYHAGGYYHGGGYYRGGYYPGSYYYGYRPYPYAPAACRYVNVCGSGGCWAQKECY